MSNTVIFEVSSAVATITLNRPDAMNTMGEDLLPRLIGHLEECASREDIRAVILTGTGRAFCAGGDLGEMSTVGVGVDPSVDDGKPPLSRAIARLRHGARSSQLLHEMPKLTIAAINGACAGAGLSWALACDVRYCSEKAVYNTAFLNAGVSGDFGASWLLPRVVGPARAREMLMFPEKFRAAEALELGVVSKVLPDDKALISYAHSRAVQSSRYAPLAVAAMKQNLNESGDLSFSTQLDRESERMLRTVETEDAREAAMAFLQKREPVFHGR